MSVVTPGEAACSIRPHSNHLVGRGRCCNRTGAGGVGETISRELLGNEDAGEEVVEAEEEAQPVNSLVSSYMPTQSERDVHDLTHATYRSWCEHCVQGRGVEMGHHLGDDHSERGVAVVGFDYMFLTQKNLCSRTEWDSCVEKDIDPELVLKILVVRDMRS